MIPLSPDSTRASSNRPGAPERADIATLMAPLGGGGAGGEAIPSIDELRDALRRSGVTLAGGGEDWIRKVSATLDQILTEHRGMADELLCVYEQLGIIFEVTRKLPTVADESEVIGLFVESLQRSFAGREVFAVRPTTWGGWVRIKSSGPDRRPAYPLSERHAAALRRCRLGKPPKAVVESFPPQAVENTDRPSSCGEDILVGPVCSGEQLIWAIVIVRRIPLDGREAAPEFRASDLQLADSLTRFCGDLIRGHRLVGEMREMSIAMVRSLVSAVDQKDEYTCGHSLRVGYYATALGRWLQLGELDLQMLQWSALLHDVGKIGIRDDVLQKQGKLTAEEFKHIQEHPTRSHRVVQEVPQLAAALDGVLHHHERYDGSGYPAGLKGEAIPLQARIIQIADVFDALTSTRSYRPAFDWRRALDILREEAGKTVDPNLQRIFDRHLRGILESDPGAWEALVQRANQFGTAFDGDTAVTAERVTGLAPGARSGPEGGDRA